MSNTHLNQLTYRYFRIALLLCLIPFFGIFLSCSVSRSVSKTVVETYEDTAVTLKKTTRKLTKGLPYLGDDLKLKVAVIGFENKSLQGGDEFRQLFLTELPEYLKNDCEFLVIGDTESDLQSLQGTSLPRLASGQIDNYALAVFGRQLGLNDFIAGSLIDIRLADETQGELWFKETFYMIRIVFRVEVFDTYTGTKTLDEIFNREVEIEELEYRLIKESKEIETPKLNETLNHVKRFPRGNRFASHLTV